MSAPPVSAVTLQLARLWERRDHNGVLFMSGKLGGLRVLIVPNQGRDDETDAEYLLILGNSMPDRKPKKER